MTECSNQDPFDLDVMAIQATLEGIDCISNVFEHESRSKRLTKARLSEKIDRDPAYVARVLNGRVSNINYQTMARFFIAMGYWPVLTPRPIAEMAGASNYCLSEIETSDYKRAEIETSDCKRGNYIFSLNVNCEKNPQRTNNMPGAMVAHVVP